MFFQFAQRHLIALSGSGMCEQIELDLRLGSRWSSGNANASRSMRRIDYSVEDQKIARWLWQRVGFAVVGERADFMHLVVFNACESCWADDGRGRRSERLADLLDLLTSRLSRAGLCQLGVAEVTVLDKEIIKPS